MYLCDQVSCYNYVVNNGFANLTFLLLICSNAIKFTHEGKVGIKLYVISNPSWAQEKESQQNLNLNQSTVSQNGAKEEKVTSQTKCDQKDFHGHGDKTHSLNEEPRTPVKSEATLGGDVDEQPHSPETTVWIRCDVYDTGIGIPGMPQIIVDMPITFVMQSIICLVFLTISFLLGWFFIYLFNACFTVFRKCSAYFV